MMTDDERQWTRLIDGELSFSDQRAFLATLDETPEGWKRLALGLLEAEAFRRELRDCVAPEPVIVSMGHEPVKRALSRRRLAALARGIGLACLGLVGVGLGMEIEQVRRPAAVVDVAIPVGGTSASAEPETRQTLKLVFADGPAGAQAVDVPVVDGEGVGAAELLRQSAVPDELRRRLEAQGYVIHEERKYVSVPLANGRQGIAPISDVVVEYEPVVFQ